MARYIERNKVIELFKKYQPTLAINVCEFGDELEKLPTEDVSPIVRGEWINTMGEEAYCSNCKGYWFSNITKRMTYCPDCGCKMEESEGKRMTREEALTLWLPIIVGGVKNLPECKEALDMAIQSLSAEKTAEWKLADAYRGLYTCSNCRLQSSKYAFCPQCGAKMKESEEE